MIIVSQDKNAIINFDNINEIRVTNTKDIIMFDNTYRSSDDCSDKLGTYETEERAKEVLEEIKKAYCCTKILQIPNINYKQEIYTKDMAELIGYEMPER